MKWDIGADDRELLHQIGELAATVAKWRGVIQREDDSGFNPPQIEQPERLAATFHCIARGFALLYGRRHLIQHDIDTLRPIAYSGMPEDRRRIYEDLRISGRLITSAIAGLLDCTIPPATKVMRELKSLGVVAMQESPTGHYIELAE